MQQTSSTTPSPTHTHINIYTWTFVFSLRRFDSGFCRGSTPLHSSSEKGHLDVCEFLVEKGANVNATNNEYDTQPYTYAYQHLLVNFCFVCNVLILVFSVEAHRCIRLLKKVTWTFANFSWKREQTWMQQTASTTPSPTPTHINIYTWTFVLFATLWFWYFQWRHIAVFFF